MLNKLVVDIAHYTKGVDPFPLHDATIQLMILKVDDLFLRNARLLVNSGMPVAAYHWIDPTVDADQQVADTLGTLRSSGLPVLALFADFEQWWSNWDEWHRAIRKTLAWNLVSRFTPNKISSHAKQVFEGFAASEWKTIGYTRASFVREFAPQAVDWMPDYRWWLAHYLEFGEQELTWETFQANILPRVNFFPDLPDGIAREMVVGHQFTGDELSLPGLYGDYGHTEASAADVNLFDEGFLAEIGAAPDPRPLPEAQYEAVVTASPSLRVRSGPGTNFDHLYSLKKGTAVQLSEMREGWGKLASFGEEWCNAEFLEIITASVPPVEDEDEPIEAGEPVIVDFPGVTYQAVRRFNANCHILIIDMTGKRFHVTPFSGFRPVSQVGRELGAQIVVNGDGWKERVPISIAASDGLFYQRIQKDFRPWVNISANNQVSFAWRNPSNLFNAVSGDRFLIQNGRYNEAITNVTKDPRTALGFIPPNRLVLLVADGRTPGVSAGLSFREIATIFLELGVTTAINLDGGGSSAMWIKDRIVNVPIHNPQIPGVERAVANHLCVFI